MQPLDPFQPPIYFSAAEPINPSEAVSSIASEAYPGFHADLFLLRNLIVQDAVGGNAYAMRLAEEGLIKIQDRLEQYRLQPSMHEQDLLQHVRQLIHAAKTAPGDIEMLSHSPLFADWGYFSRSEPPLLEFIAHKHEQIFDVESFLPLRSGRPDPIAVAVTLPQMRRLIDLAEGYWKKVDSKEYIHSFDLIKRAPFDFSQIENDPVLMPLYRTIEEALEQGPAFLKTEFLSPKDVRQRTHAAIFDELIDLSVKEGSLTEEQAAVQRVKAKELPSNQWIDPSFLDSDVEKTQSLPKAIFLLTHSERVTSLIGRSLKLQEPTTIYFDQWDPTMDRNQEYRCFFNRSRAPNGLCGFCTFGTKTNRNLDPEDPFAQSIIASIQNWFTQNYKKIPYQQAVIDLGVQGTEVKAIEANPFYFIHRLGVGQVLPDLTGKFAFKIGDDEEFDELIFGITQNPNDPPSFPKPEYRIHVLSKQHAKWWSE